MQVGVFQFRKIIPELKNLNKNEEPNKNKYFT